MSDSHDSLNLYIQTAEWTPPATAVENAMIAALMHGTADSVARRGVRCRKHQATLSRQSGERGAELEVQRVVQAKASVILLMTALVEEAIITTPAIVACRQGIIFSKFNWQANLFDHLSIPLFFNCMWVGCGRLAFC